MGAALQSLTSAPRLLQAITKDELIPPLNIFNKIDSRGEPVRALLATVAIACGAEKEWGDGFAGLQLSAANYALLLIEDGPTHTKNWRPQVLVMLKLKHDHTAKHRKLLSFASQLKAGKGLTLVATCLEGKFNAQAYCEKESAKRTIHKQMNDEKVKGFCSVLVAKKISEGCSSIIQTAGLGGLRHNTVIVSWPCEWKTNPSKVTQFMNIIKTVTLNRNALLIPRGIDNWPETGDRMGGNIDVWWIVHDGGLLMLIPFLLRKHKTWKNCHLRIFTVAQISDNSVQMKRDLQQWIYALRIEARSVEVIELNDHDISEYTYERTVRMEQRTGQLRQLYFRGEKEASGLQDTATIQQQMKAASTENLNQSDSNVKDKNSNKLNSDCPKFNLQEATPQQSPNLDEKRNNNFTRQQDTPSPNSKTFGLKPDEINVKRMNTAVKLNEAITAKSSTSKLVIINLPGLPKNTSNEIECHHYLEFLDVLCEGLERVILVRGSGREKLYQSVQINIEALVNFLSKE
ncbi:hypothetical protein RND71_043500 [Anisodus tanguticus]|uniref:Uncharacterized protein n=1 Tax=Anisodus tanguticus TaxID=243964 RepID=A0AAE1UU73_9SOLA|nr:hypothetical protein RND71_043500 [Anisodus tanguticus]